MEQINRILGKLINHRKELTLQSKLFFNKLHKLSDNLIKIEAVP